MKLSLSRILKNLSGDDKCDIDDSIQSRPKNAPSDYQPLVENYRRLGLYLSHEKRQTGAIVEYVGYQLNFETKTIQIRPRTIAKAQEKLETGFKFDPESCGLAIGLEELEQLLGSIEFLSNCSFVGRSRSSHLTNLLNIGRREGKDRVVLDSSCYSEVMFWKAYCSAPTLVPMAEQKMDLYQIKSYSDASTSKWAYLMYGDSKTAGAGQFPASYNGESILLKECYALYQLTLVLKPETNNLVHCDNQSLVAMYRKTRSTKNLLVTRYLELIHLELFQRRSVMELIWINTDQMNEYGADGLSRGRSDKIFEPYSLSEKGKRYMMRIYGRFDIDIAVKRLQKFCTILQNYD